MLFTPFPRNQCVQAPQKSINLMAPQNAKESVALREGHCLVLSCHITPKLTRDACKCWSNPSPCETGICADDDFLWGSFLKYS